jgi:hypothetical protein
MNEHVDMLSRQPNSGEITSECPGTFARFTLEKRLPKILHDARSTLVQTNDVIIDKLHILHSDLQSLGDIRPFEDLPRHHAEYWNARVGRYKDRSWLSAPFMWIEFYFYWRLLEATDYFRTNVDPFWQLTEWTGLGQEILHQLPPKPRQGQALPATASGQSGCS